LIGASLSGEPEEKRPRVYVDGDNANIDLKEVWWEALDWINLTNIRQAVTNIVLL
jgi:hypothetical protein